MTDKIKEHWLRYYHDNSIVGSRDLHKNVGRTKAGKSIDASIWQSTITDIIKLIDVNTADTVLELCCGNGEVLGNIVPLCKKAIGVDYSDKLLKQFKSQYGESAELIHGDVLDVDFPKGSIDIIIIYFSIQHFSELETIQLIKRSINWLKKGGRIFIGDIPNLDRMWEYVDKPEYRKDYIRRIVDQDPLIGTWFQPKFFDALQDYFGGIKIQILKQPSYQINSSHRFDVLITKGEK